MKYTTFFLCACSILLLGSCKKQPVQNEQPLEVMTFNIRLDAPSDSANITQVVAQARQFLITNTCFYMLLSLVNIVRFLIQGMGFSGFAVFAGVFEMIARALIGLIFVPIFGFTAACFASPLAWLFADCFLLPAFFHCRKKLMRGLANK